MKIKKVLVFAFFLFLLNFICLLESKKVLLTVIGMHALRRMQGLQHLRDFVTVYLPVRHAVTAWKSFGKVAATTPHMPKFLHGFKEGHHAKHIKLSHEEGYEMDNWLHHHFPEESHGYK